MASDWFRERRLDAIDAILADRGWIRRIDLMEMFGISTPQATIDIKVFVAAYPDSIIYDRALHRYVPSAPYQRRRSLSERNCKTFLLLAGWALDGVTDLA